MTSRESRMTAGIHLVLSLVMLRYVDEAILPPFWKWIAIRATWRAAH